MTIFHEFFYQIKNEINLKSKTKDDRNFYEIGPWIPPEFRIK